MCTLEQPSVPGSQDSASKQILCHNRFVYLNTVRVQAELRIIYCIGALWYWNVSFNLRCVTWGEACNIDSDGNFSLCTFVTTTKMQVLAQDAVSLPTVYLHCMTLQQQCTHADGSVGICV